MLRILKYVTIVIFFIFTHGSQIFAVGDGCGDLMEKSCEVTSTCLVSRIIDFIKGLSGFENTRVGDHNDLVIENINTESVPQAKGKRKSALTSAEIAKLFKSVEDHPVASMSQIKKYDPENLGIGFCFGRAMTTHLEALWNFSLQNASIQKVWAVGKLVSGESEWRYHVTTIVKGTDGKWWAIDPVFDGPVTIEHWYSQMKENIDSNGKMVIFNTSARRFGADYNTAYDKRSLENRLFNNFFVDLLKEYQGQRNALKKN